MTNFNLKKLISVLRKPTLRNDSIFLGGIISNIVQEGDRCLREQKSCKETKRMLEFIRDNFYLIEYLIDNIDGTIFVVDYHCCADYIDVLEQVGFDLPRTKRAMMIFKLQHPEWTTLVD